MRRSGAEIGYLHPHPLRKLSLLQTSPVTAEEEAAYWAKLLPRVSKLEAALVETPEDQRHTRRNYRRLDKSGRKRARAAGVTRVDYVDRQEIIDRDKQICHLCGERVEEVSDIHLDHVIPIARGGSHSASNLAVAHAACNLRKGANYR